MSKNVKLKEMCVRILDQTKVKGRSSANISVCAEDEKSALPAAQAKWRQFGIHVSQSNMKVVQVKG